MVAPSWPGRHSAHFEYSQRCLTKQITTLSLFSCLKIKLNQIKFFQQIITSIVYIFWDIAYFIALWYDCNKHLFVYTVVKQGLLKHFLTFRGGEDYSLISGYGTASLCPCRLAERAVCLVGGKFCSTFYSPNTTFSEIRTLIYIRFIQMRFVEEYISMLIQFFRI